MPRFAGLWPRILAFGCDYLIIASYLVGLALSSVAIHAFSPAILPRFFASPASGQITGFVLITLPVTLYFALLESSPWQGTWGKHRLGLQVTTRTGKRLSLAHALARTMLKFIPWELAHTCIWQVRVAGQEDSPWVLAGFLLVWVLGGANALCMGITRTHQALYDWVAGTVVIRSMVADGSDPGNSLARRAKD